MLKHNASQQVILLLSLYVNRCRRSWPKKTTVKYAFVEEKWGMLIGDWGSLSFSPITMVAPPMPDLVNASAVDIVKERFVSSVYLCGVSAGSSCCISGHVDSRSYWDGIGKLASLQMLIFVWMLLRQPFSTPSDYRPSELNLLHGKWLIYRRLTFVTRPLCTWLGRTVPYIIYLTQSCCLFIIYLLWELQRTGSVREFYSGALFWTAACWSGYRCWI